MLFLSTTFPRPVRPELEKEDHQPQVDRQLKKNNQMPNSSGVKKKKKMDGTKDRENMLRGRRVCRKKGKNRRGKIKKDKSRRMEGEKKQMGEEKRKRTSQ